jgi:hypothetical protein
VTLFRLVLPFSVALLSLTACSSTTSSSGSNSSGAGSETQSATPDESGTTADVVGGSEGDIRPPEFRAIRGAIQPVTEFKPEAGQRMADVCMQAEVAVPGGDADAVEKHLRALVDIMDESAMKELPDRSRVGMLAAISKDIKALGGKSGAPKLKLTESKDKLCGKDGKCSKDAPGALCYRLAFSDGAASCACTSPSAVKVSEDPGTEPSTEDDASETTESSASAEDAKSEDSVPSASSAQADKAGSAATEEKGSTEVSAGSKDKSAKSSVGSAPKSEKSTDKAKTGKPKSKGSTKIQPAATKKPRKKSSE